MDIERREIDGALVYGLPGKPALEVLVSFRTGTLDESLSQVGITHLIEHLVTNDLGANLEQVAASVDATWTNFTLFAPPAQLNGLLAELLDRLGRLPMERRAAEQKVLAVEAAGLRVGSVDRIQHARFGSAAGNLECEWGLETASDEDVRLWCRSRFTRNNCVLIFQGDIPRDIDLSCLPAGQRQQPTTPLDPAIGARSHMGGMDFVDPVMSILADDKDAAVLKPILRKRLFHELRMVRALTYSPTVTVTWLGGIDHWTIASDALEEDRQEVRQLMFETVDKFIDGGPTEEEVGTQLEFLRFSRAQTPRYLASAAAVSELCGLYDPEVDGDYTDTLLSRDYVAAAQAWAGTQLYVVDDEAEVPEHAPLRDMTIEPLPAGSQVMETVSVSNSLTMRVQTGGLLLEKSQEPYATLRWDDARGAIHYESGEIDVIGRFVTLRIRPWDWSEGEALLKEVRRCVTSLDRVDVNEKLQAPESEQPTKPKKWWRWLIYAANALFFALALWGTVLWWQEFTATKSPQIRAAFGLGSLFGVLAGTLLGIALLLAASFIAVKAEGKSEEGSPRSKRFFRLGRRSSGT